MITKPGDQFGRLTVIRQLDQRSKWKAIIFECKCICGTIKNLTGISLRSGKVQSCGCLSRETGSTQGYLNRKPPGEVSYNTMYASYRYAAIKRGLEFKITIEEFKYLTAQNCYYCNACPRDYSGYNKIKAVSSESYKASIIQVNGIDRINNEIGYVYSNCTSACTKCNLSKLDSSQADFIEHCKRIAKRF